MKICINTSSFRKIDMRQEACLRLQIKRKDGSFGINLQFGLFKDEFIK